MVDKPPAGEKKPQRLGVREIAKRVGVAPMTVVRAYAQLRAEGVVESRAGSATQVASRPSASMAERMLAYRDRVGDGAFHDVAYHEFTADPVAATAALYDRFGIPLTAEAEAAMRAHVADAPQGKHGTHRYELADFGLDEAQVTERFAAYLDRFGEYV